MNGGELCHYQVKGAKHGVRRYQYKDGSLTPLGRQHYGIGDPRKKSILPFKKKEKPAPKKEEAPEKEEPKEKKPDISEMTTEQLNAAINRLRLEQQYRDLITPKREKQVNNGKKYAEKFRDKMLDSTINAVGNVTQKYVEKKLANWLGVKLDSKKEKKNNDE